MMEQYISVEVCEINKNAYAHMMYKTFNGTNYNRLAQPEVKKYTISNIRRLFDTSGTIIYLS